MSAELNTIRTEKKKLRNAIVGQTRLDHQASIIKNLLSLEEVIDAEVLAIYLSTDGEVDVTEIGADGRPLALPVTLAALGDPTMYFARYHLGDPLVKGRFRILVPEEVVTVTPDVVITPLVAFDDTGARIGRGGGFYDRYFAEHDVIRIGVGFEDQIVESIEVEPHDERLDYMVTEVAVRNFERVASNEDD